MWKDKTNHQTIGCHRHHNIEEDLVKTGRDAMDKENFSEMPDEDQLEKRPDSHQEHEQGIQNKGRASDRSRSQTSETRDQKPAEKHQGDGDFITVKLRQEFPNGDKLNCNGRDSRAYDRPYD
jgi:hypothetical protein